MQITNIKEAHKLEVKVGDVIRLSNWIPNLLKDKFRSTNGERLAPHTKSLKKGESAFTLITIPDPGKVKVYVFPLRKALSIPIPQHMSLQMGYLSAVKRLEDTYQKNES